MDALKMKDMSNLQLQLEGGQLEEHTLIKYEGLMQN
jgi:hypothetical protein